MIKKEKKASLAKAKAKASHLRKVHVEGVSGVGAAAA